MMSAQSRVSAWWPAALALAVACGGPSPATDDAGAAMDLSAPVDQPASIDLLPTLPDLVHPLCAHTDGGVPVTSGGLGHYQTVAFPPENPYTPEKAMLGKILFWDEQLSSDDTVACGTCHRPSAGGADPRAGMTGSRHPGPDGVLGTADDPHGARGIARCDDSTGTVVYKSDVVFELKPQVTRRRAPSYLDAMFPLELLWDRRARTYFLDPQNPDGGVAIATGGALESQVVGPPVNDSEMACESRTWAKVAAKLATARPLALARDVPNEMAAAICRNPTYPLLFQAAFGSPDITAVRIAFAIATHERTLVSSETPWDHYTQNATALTTSQEAGRVVFFNKGQCIRCHLAPLFASDGAVNLGLQADSSFDTGLQEITGVTTDAGKFRTVSLRNVGLREAQGMLHDGVGKGIDMPTLMLAYDVPPQLSANTDVRMLNTVRLNLNTQEINDLVEFLRTALTDPRVAAEKYPFNRPKLKSEP